MMHRPSWFICPLTTALFLKEWCSTAQAQIQGISGVCSVPINVQSLPFETATTILQITTPAIEMSLCGFNPTDQGYAYTVTGTDKVMRAIVFSWGSTDPGTLGLFTGECDAAAMTCITSQGLNAIVSARPLVWEGRAGVKYTLVVAGDLFYGPSIGYSLEITENEGPLNDSCDSAMAASSLPFSAIGDTTGAFPDFDVRTCSVSPDVRGVWYKFVGNGRIVRVRLTNGNFRLRIFLFKGSCTDFFCDGNSNGGSGADEVDFLGDASVEYFVLVTGYNADSDVGTFTIDITELDLLPNHNCDSAMEINGVPFSVTGDTTGAVSGHYDPSCGGDTDTRGIWYTVTGHDKIITFAVSNASFDVRTGVYTGDCDNLQPIKCWLSGWGGAPAWAGLVGVQYTIMVMGYQRFSHVGTFDLDVYETERPSNDDCSYAEVVESLPFFGNYDTRGAHVETVANPGSPEARGVWFKFVGGGGTIEVLLSSLTFDADLRFYSGSCGNLTPIVIPSWTVGSTILRAPLSTTAGEQYFVLATGENGFYDVGTFGTEITGTQVLSPDDGPATESPTDPNSTPTEDQSTASPTVQDTSLAPPPAALSPGGQTNEDSEAPSTIRSLGAIFVQVVSLLAALLLVD